MLAMKENNPDVIASKEAAMGAMCTSKVDASAIDAMTKVRRLS